MASICLRSIGSATSEAGSNVGMGGATQAIGQGWISLSVGNSGRDREATASIMGCTGVGIVGLVLLRIGASSRQGNEDLTTERGMNSDAEQCNNHCWGTVALGC